MNTMNPRADLCILVVVDDAPVLPAAPLPLGMAGAIRGAVRGFAEVLRDFHTHYFPFLPLR